jgi:hypothetical protein
MGCDIHLYVEKLENGVWMPADQWVPDEDDERKLSVPYGTGFYDGRNYDLFAILANVRNGYGFAGCDTGDGFVPIAMPRGLPDGVTPVVKAESDYWDCDGHSHSWLTLAEILAYDWTQTTKQRGWVNGPEFEEWERLRKWDPEPKSHCGGVSGGSIQHISSEEMARRVQVITESLGNGVPWCAVSDRLSQLLRDTYCQVEWEIDYARCCQEFWWNTIPRLLRLGPPEHTRLVFWFDN